MRSRRGASPRCFASCSFSAVLLEFEAPFCFFRRCWIPGFFSAWRSRVGPAVIFGRIFRGRRRSELGLASLTGFCLSSDVAVDQFDEERCPL